MARRSRLEEQGWLVTALGVTALGVIATIALVTAVGVLVSNFVGEKKGFDRPVLVTLSVARSRKSEARRPMETAPEGTGAGEGLFWPRAEVGKGSSAPS